jgi:hypothetical protein
LAKLLCLVGKSARHHAVAPRVGVSNLVADRLQLDHERKQPIINQALSVGCHANFLFEMDDIQQASQDQEIKDLESFMEAAGIDRTELGKRKPYLFDMLWPGGPKPESQQAPRSLDPYSDISPAATFTMQ